MTASPNFQNIFKNIDNALRKDSGCSGEIDYIEQTSWILFLKYLEDFEVDRQKRSELTNSKYQPIIAPEFRWASWAFPKDSSGKLDYQKALTGEDLIEFVNLKLFPYLSKFKNNDQDFATIEYKIGEIFSELKNKIQSGYNLREVIDLIDQLRFRSSQDRHEMSALYEDKISRMGNAGRNGGEYYTPRPLIRAMVKVIQPKVGETIYDGAVGSAGFLVEAFDYMMAQPNLSASDIETLQHKTLYGQEKKVLAYIIGMMNMILHGVEAPNLLHTNTLSQNVSEIQDKDRHDIVLANPPFGGKERTEVQENFPIRTSETAFLFMQHFIKKMKAGGRGAIVIKNTFLSNTDNASVSLRKLILETCNLHTILDCPGGTFIGAGVKTVVLFFDKGRPTQKTWYYQLDPGRNMGKTNPLNDEDLKEFVEMQRESAVTPKSWLVETSTVDQKTFDLSVKNPDKGEEVVQRTPQEILDEIEKLDAESSELLKQIRGIL